VPKIDSLDKAGQLLIEAAQDLKNVTEGYGPEYGRRATSDQALYAMIQDLTTQLTRTAVALGKIGTQLRNAAGELENLDET
jgi:hypothetical protein